MNVVVLGILCSPASNSAVSLIVKSEFLGRLMRLFVKQQDIISSPSIMKLSLSFIRLCIESGKIPGFELLGFVETRHVSFMLQPPQ